MSDETRRVLDLLAQGKITVDEASDLLKALGESDARTTDGVADAPANQRLRYLRIAVKKNRTVNGESRAYSWAGCIPSGTSGPREVNIRVPFSLVRSGMRLGAIIPGGGDFIAQALHDRGIQGDFSKMTPEQLETILKEMGEITVDVDHGRAQVRISAE